MTEAEDDATHVRIATAETLLGQLQRGRGAGFLAALDMPRSQAWSLLIECITHDPRWDSQLEDRGGYYAALILASGMPLDPIARRLREQDGSQQWGGTLCIEVLAHLARRRHASAALLLRQVAESADTLELWQTAFDALMETQDPSAMAGLRAARHGSGPLRRRACVRMLVGM